jgi:hypothetical protein
MNGLTITTVTGNVVRLLAVFVARGLIKLAMSCVLLTR